MSFIGARSDSTSSDVQYTEAAGGARGFPQLEGVKINDHWAIIYSKFDIGCALERHTGIDCKGYTHESAVEDRRQHRDLFDVAVIDGAEPDGFGFNELHQW